MSAVRCTTISVRPDIAPPPGRAHSDAGDPREALTGRSSTRSGACFALSIGAFVIFFSFGRATQHQAGNRDHRRQATDAGDAARSALTSAVARAPGTDRRRVFTLPQLLPAVDDLQERASAYCRGALHSGRSAIGQVQPEADWQDQPFLIARLLHQLHAISPRMSQCSLTPSSGVDRKRRYDDVISSPRVSDSWGLRDAIRL
jgi:hypothetical protein